MRVLNITVEADDFDSPDGTYGYRGVVKINGAPVFNGTPGWDVPSAEARAEEEFVDRLSEVLSRPITV